MCSKKVTLWLLALLLACGPKSKQEPEPVIRPVDSSLCGKACAKMQSVGPDGGPCEEAQPIQVGDASVICTEMCEYDHKNGVDWNTSCLVNIKTCSEIESQCSP
jgi:hypothetical protein